MEGGPDHANRVRAILGLVHGVCRPAVQRATDLAVTDFDKAGLIPKKPKVRLKAVIDDGDLLDLIQEVEGLNRGWANILRLLTQLTLRNDLKAH